MVKVCVPTVYSPIFLQSFYSFHNFMNFKIEMSTEVIKLHNFSILKIIWRFIN